MSKRMTKVLSLILTLVMFLSITPPAFAWGSGELGPGLDRDIGEDEVRDFEIPEDFEEEEEPLDYFQTTNELNGSMVTVEAPMGSLPSLAELRAEPVAVDEIQAAVNSVLNTDANILVAMDISFWLNDVEIEPEEPVRVKISAPELDGKQNLTLVHIPDAAEPETVDLLSEDELSFALGTNEIAFQADSFSVYAVVDGEGDPESRLTVNFFGLEQGENAAPVATVYVKNGDQLLGTGERQTNVSYIEDIVFDPGVGGTLPENQLFLGWTIDDAEANKDEEYDTAHFGAGYTTKTKPYTIGELRSYLGTLTESNAIKEGDVLNVYAMIFKVFTVTYEHEDVVVASYDVLCLRTENTAPYTITETFTAVDDIHHFDGWNAIEGGTNISEPSAAAPYPQGTTMKLSGNVRFSTKVSKGHWLVFEENAYGATYNAPVFVKTGETAYQNRPALSEDDSMFCSGYRFGGWYVLKNPSTDLNTLEKNGDYYVINDDFEPFVWEQELTDKVFLFAKWTVEEETNYTVIVWKQAVADDKNLADAYKTYDYAFSVEVKNAQSLAAVSSLDLSAYQNKDGQTITVDGKDYSFVGFKYNTTKGVVTKNTVKNSNNVDAVNPNGTTVVNLYYDRELVTYNFRVYGYSYTLSTSTDTGWYYIPNGSGGYTEVRLYRDGGTWYRNRTWVGGIFSGHYEYSDPYDGDVYTRSYFQDWNIRETMTGLYGQKLTAYEEYSWPTDYRWFVGEDSDTFQSHVDVFTSSYNANPSDPFVTDWYGKSADFNTQVRHYLQNMDGSYPTEATYTIPTQVSNGMVFRDFQGYTASKVRIKLPDGVTRYQTGDSYSGNTLNNATWHDAINGWTDWVPAGVGIEFSGNSYHEIGLYYATSGGPNGGIEFRYTRNTYELTYMVGRFVNKDQQTMTPKFSGQLKQVEGIPYDASIADYAESGSKYYNPDTVAEFANQTKEFVFVGWYIDETCTTEAEFDGNMPDGGMTVYGKWQQKEYRVFLHPNAGTDPTLDWGSGSQQMNFKVANGSKISLPTGKRTGYEFLGWYTDEAMTTSYSVDSRLNDTTVPAIPEYDKTAQMTENADGSDMDKWGNLEPGAVNKDVDRPWVQRKLDLYAKWSEVLPGAEGIGVRYNANGGNPAPTDTKLYKDNVSAVAQAAPSTAPTRVDNGVSHPQKFLYWVMQTWDETANNGQGDYVDLDGEQYHKYPGETFLVLKEHAKVVENGVDEEGNKLYTYTVQLRAEWGDVDAPTPTHIDWYSNLRDVAGHQMKLNTFTHTTDSTSSVEDKGWVVKDENKQINEEVDIRPATTYSYPGYKFLGWAKTPDATTEDELFLKWVNNHYEAKDADGHWVTVTKVAADEKQPYDNLYAIWSGQYCFVYHSSDNSFETIDLANLNGGKINLQQKVREGFLYGGYYTDYAGKSTGFDYDKAYQLFNAKENEDTAGTEYLAAAIEASYEKDTNALYTGYWTYANGGKENGTAMTPVGGTVYYLKEVPVTYLRPYTQYTYYKASSQIGTIWAVTDLDELNYKSAGFVVTVQDTNTPKPATLKRTITFSAQNGGEDAKVTLTAKKAFNVDGWIGWAEVVGFATEAAAGDPIPSAEKIYTIRMFWTTRDGVQVFGDTMRVLETRDGTVKAETGLKATDTPCIALTNP